MDELSGCWLALLWIIYEINSHTLWRAWPHRCVLKRARKPFVRKCSGFLARLELTIRYRTPRAPGTGSKPICMVSLYGEAWVTPIFATGCRYPVPSTTRVVFPKMEMVCLTETNKVMCRTRLPFYHYKILYCKIPIKAPLAQIEHVNCRAAATRYLVSLTCNAQKLYIGIRKSIL